MMNFTEVSKAISEVSKKSMDMPKFVDKIKPESIFSMNEADRKLCEAANLKEEDIYKEANVKQEYVNGRECYIKADIDYSQKDDFGKTNLERMKDGKCPISTDGQKIELHHIGQKMDAPLIELTTKEHRGQGNDTILHDKQKESEIDRSKFNTQKSNHWKARAAMIEEMLAKGEKS